VTITKEYLLSEMEEVRREAEKARVFLIQAETSLSLYAMLIRKIEESEEEQSNAEHQTHRGGILRS
jgi:hypothetical protein